MRRNPQPEMTLVAVSDPKAAMERTSMAIMRELSASMAANRAAVTDHERTLGGAYSAGISDRMRPRCSPSKANFPDTEARAAKVAATRQ